MMISILMPIWNGAVLMDRAIASVVAQTSPAWELLIVDDGSADDSLDRAHRWQSMINSHSGTEKIRVFSTGMANSGPAVAKNLAAEHARGEIFSYLDHDDLYYPRRIESILPLARQFDMVFSPYEILEKGRLTLWNIRALWERQSSVCDSEGKRTPSFAEWAHAFLQRRNISVGLGVAHRRSMFDQVGGFQPGIVVGSDGVLWRRMVERGMRVFFCPIIAGRYYVRADSQARTRRRFSTGGFEMQKDHPLGSNGQYLDAEWFAALPGKEREECGI